MKIAGYDIIEQLSESEKSRVYLGRQTEGEGLAVLKTSLPGTAARLSEALLRNEYETTRGWEGSPVQPLHFQNIEQGVVLIRPYLQGSAWAEWVGRHKPGLEAALQLAIAAASELEILHRRDIIHKNIHPHNLIVDPAAKRVSLIDHCLSTRYDLKSQYAAWPGQIAGKLAYLSPEQTGRMNRVVDYRCDLYAFGVMLYELLTGRLPFDAAEPLELMYSHLARTPAPLHTLDANIPPVLSRIVLKLLAKNAEDRYQSASSVRKDLEQCLQQWTAGQKAGDFAIARFDAPLRFSIPQKIYGRAAERADLIAAFEKAASGRKQLALVGGYSGAGKTALVFDLHIPVTKKRGIFISGKFEQFQRNIPYLAWRQAFDQFTEQVLTEGQSGIQHWRTIITEALGDLTGVITSLLPALEKITGPQPEPPQLPATEVQNRFNYAFRSFVRAICIREHPLVVFLDDFQWADAASLNLLRLVMTEPGLGYLFVIGAFRENEVYEGHPFLICIEELEQEWRAINETDVSLAFSPDNTLISRYSLGKLPEENLEELVRDTLDASPRLARELAQLLLQKTGGNAYFVHRFLESLHEEGHIRLEHPEGAAVWRFDTDNIRALRVTDNVVDLLTRKVDKMTAAARHVLNAAACVGHSFDLDTLALILQKPPREVEAALWQAVEEGLIVPLEPEQRFLTGDGDGLASVRFNFAHDRVRQAVYEALPLEEKAGIHRQAGILLLQTLPENEQAERIFEIVNHINETGASFTDRALKSRLNYEAGLRAKSSAAYAPAFEFFRKALDSLPPGAWQTDYAETLRLHNQTAETAYLSGNDEEMERLIDLILSKAVTTIDKVTALEIRIIALFSRQRIRESIALGLEALTLLGVKLPAKPGQAQVAMELVKAKMAMRNKTPEQLLELPLVQHPEHLAVMRIMANLAPPVFFVDTNLYSIILFRLMVFTSRYGIASSSAYAYSCYSFVLCAITNEVNTGSRYGEFVLDLMKKHPFSEYQSRALFVLYYFVQHWKNPLPGIVPSLKDAYRRSLESGEADFTAFLGNAYAQAAIMSGNDLEELDKELRRQLQYSTQTRHYTSVTFNNIFHQFVLCLRNQAPAPRLLKGEMCDADALFDEMARINNAPVIFNIAYFRAQLALLHGDFTDALANIEIAHVNLKSVISIPVYKHHHFLAVLVRYHACVENAHLKRKQMARIKSSLDALRKYQQYNPGEFSGKLALAEACFAALHGEHDKALGLFHRAMGSFQHEGNTYDQGLGSLELFRYARLRDLDDLAAIYHRKAADAFRHWGAEAVVHYLQSLPGYSVKASVLDSADTPVGGRVMDLFSIIKGAQVISGELELQLLVNKMLAVMAENAGATRGALILKKPGGYFVEAEMKEAGVVENVAALPFEQYEPAATGVLNYVLHSGQNIVLDNAVAEGRFVNDPYIRKHRVRSLLCMNLLYKNQTVGLLYLENNLVPGAFTAGRMEVLQILGTQAAISIENANYYTDIQALNRAYERFVPRVFLQQLGKASILDIGLGDQVSKNMAVMFSDIWGFTTLSESVSEGEVFALLNDIWGRLTPVIENHGGIVDKFVGDAVLALFPENVQHCLAAAVEMQRKILEFNTESPLRPAYPIRMGIGVNTGPMILGTVGASSRLDTTVIGDAVNVSARLEDMTRVLRTHIILSADAVIKLNDPARFNLRCVGLLELRGKTQPIRLYEEFSNDDPALLQQKKQHRSLFADFLRVFESGDQAAAGALIGQYLDKVPGDEVGGYYRELLGAGDWQKAGKN